MSVLLRRETDGGGIDDEHVRQGIGMRPGRIVALVPDQAPVFDPRFVAGLRVWF